MNMSHKPTKSDLENAFSKYSTKPAGLMFPNNAEKLRNKICVTCGSKIIGFKNAISLKEFLISGMCQKCQDKVFC